MKHYKIFLPLVLSAIAAQGLAHDSDEANGSDDSISISSIDVTPIFERLHQLEATIAKLQNRLDQAENELDKMSLMQSAKVSSQAPAATQLSPKLTEETLAFRSIMGTIRQKNYTHARIQLAIFLKTYPEGEKTADAKFWLAELYLKSQKYHEAIGLYENYLEHYPLSERNAKVTLQLITALSLLGELPRAREVFESFASRFPESEMIHPMQSVINKTHERA